MSKVKILIYVEGGVVTEVKTDAPMDVAISVHVADFDEIEIGYTDSCPLCGVEVDGDDLLKSGVCSECEDKAVMMRSIY